MSRERFDVNGAPTDPSDCWREIRALLLTAASQHPAHGATPSDAEVDTGPGNCELVNREDDDPSGGVASMPSTRDTDGSTRCAASSAAGGDAAAGDEVSSAGMHGAGGNGRGGNGEPWGVGSGRKGGVRGNDRASKSGLEMYVDQCAWRVLHAASRTASGGDCFFVVQARRMSLCENSLRPIGERVGRHISLRAGQNMKHSVPS